MAIQVKDEVHSSHLKVLLVGDFDVADVPVTADRIIESCAKHQKEKVLVDVMGLEGNPNFMERFTLSTVFAAKYLKARVAKEVPSCLFAVVGKHPLVDPQRFEETVAKNRGTPVKTFTDMKEALMWLGVQEADEK